ncbi:MAG: MoaD/ThiS family protein [Desulfurococcales archaeon]|nr:MoaD/ThiS family protein [Desulfurococcales archaeon]MCE4605528.1 MoaD/ThiS family protein [Desulfurococcales archaeon]
MRLVFIQEFYKAVGRFQVDADLPEGSTVRDAIEYVDREVYKGFKDLVLEGDGVKYPVEIAVNGRRIDFLDGLHTKLNEGDQVLFSPRALFVL